MNRLLRLAEFLCGEDTRARVFDPLVADWQRELADAPDSRSARARVLLSGGAAIAIAIAHCWLTEGLPMSMRDTILKSAAISIVSTAAILVLQVLINNNSVSVNWPWEVRFRLAVPMILPLMVPMAMLPIMMLMRGGGLSASSASMMTATGALLAYLSAAWLSPFAQGDIITPRLEEAIYQKALANELAGRVSYPWTTVRNRRPTTLDQRIAAREKFRHSEMMIKARADRMRPRWGWSSVRFAALSLALSAFGWALAGIGRTRMTHASAYWALALVAVVILDGRISYWVNGGLVTFQRSPYWVPLAVFSTAALAVSIASRGGLLLERPRRQRRP